MLHSCLRAVLMTQTWHAAQLTFASAAAVLGTGLAFDLVALALALPALLMLEAALGSRKPAGRIRRGGVLAVAALGLFALGFGVMAEWFFWDEFGVRFNFIAVDYLVYTREVVGNIRESFPVGTLLGALAVITLALVWASRSWLLRAASPAAKRNARVVAWLASVAVAAGLASVWSMDARHGSNEYQKELSANGLYSLGYAFGNNEIDYFDFYATRPLTVAAPAAALPRIVSATPPKNIVIVTMESLSSSYMAHGGNTRGLTPNLDRLAGQGLFLANLHATGNRTVRGLEALSLAIPPLPGHSIIWRKHNQNLETLGAVLADHGYVNRFMYGGYARFDNMDAYFAGNHYQPIDRGQFPERHRSFGNIWGVADEHLYDYALEQMDRDAASGKPFLMHLMTTSNHTPFTFPEGRIDLPRGRPGAVKYSDWAVGRFIEQARSKPWFKDTVFVLVADHCASSKGRVSLPPENYHIPAIVYSPAHVAPHIDTRLASQIDLVPTVLDLLGLPEHTRFMGRSVLHIYPDAGRAFIATYQKLGYLTPDQLVVLSPGRKIEDWRLDAHQELAGPVHQPDTLVTRAIGAYQETARRARDGLLQHVNLPDGLRVR
ncbi:MAG: LTA synthase family protein [Thiobacillus sp.]|nr:LTA synthase family protein [Thiobacillus sp.]